MKIINPNDIKRIDLPLFVLSDDLRSFFSWGIRLHTKNNYSHIMIMVEPGSFVTQGFTYSKVPIKKYLKPQIRLKFWQYKNISHNTIVDIIEAVRKDLAKSWWLKQYDPIGIIGQALHLRCLQIPWRHYCTERVIKYIQLTRLPIKIRRNPGEIDKFFESREEMQVYGYWWKE